MSVTQRTNSLYFLTPVLQVLDHTTFKTPRIQKLLLKHHISELKTISYCGVPSNIGIYGNDKIDLNAKKL